MQNGRSPNGPKEISSIDNESIGRYHLNDWREDQPDNFFAYDKYFQRSLEYLWGRSEYQRQASRLYQSGEDLAQIVAPLLEIASQDPNLPRLEHFDAIGLRKEDVEFHPYHHQIGRHIYGSGMMSVYRDRGNNLLSLALFFLSSQLGEAGHNCALACTSGLIKLLQAKGSAYLQRQFLPHLLSDDYDNHYTAAQYLTEVQGGSDVGANSTWAKQVQGDEAIWALSGQKWFCSNITAELALVSARVPGQGDGTSGLGLFLMPRYLPDKRLNNFHILRLKDKLGTRLLATGEMELQKALAYQVGRVEDGFKNLMTYVINTSRIYNAVAACGGARRSYVIAATYANHRQAFGRKIIQFPIVQEMLANMRADYMAVLAGTFHIIHLLDKIELHKSGGNAEEFLRVAINLNKYRSAEIAHEVIMRAIELLGGNGTIETFSSLPTLLRDNIVYEKWEGTDNVILAQVLRDIRRYRFHQPFLAAVNALLSAVSDEAINKLGLQEVENLGSEIDEILSMDELTAGIYFRPWAVRLTDLYYAASLASEGQWELNEKRDKTKLRLCSLFFNRRILSRGPKDIAYYDDAVSRLCL